MYSEIIAGIIILLAGLVLRQFAIRVNKMDAEKVDKEMYDRMHSVHEQKLVKGDDRFKAVETKLDGMSATLIRVDTTLQIWANKNGIKEKG